MISTTWSLELPKNSTERGKIEFVFRRGTIVAMLEHYEVFHLSRLKNFSSSDSFKIFQWIFFWKQHLHVENCIQMQEVQKQQDIVLAKPVVARTKTSKQNQF